MRVRIPIVVLAGTIVCVGLGMLCWRARRVPQQFALADGYAARIVFRPNRGWDLVEITDKQTLHEIMQWLSSLEPRRTGLLPVPRTEADQQLTIEMQDGSTYTMLISATCGRYADYMAGAEYCRSSYRCSVIKSQGTDWQGDDNPFTHYLWGAREAKKWIAPSNLRKEDVNELSH